MLIGAPAMEPVSLAEAMSWLREDASDEDQLIQALIVSARMTLEAYTRRFFVAQDWRLVFDAWPSSIRTMSSLAIPFAPFRTVTAIRIYDVANAPALAPTNSYRAAAASDGGRIIFNAPPQSPGRRADGIEVDFSVGYGPLATDTPEPLRRAMLLLVAHWRERRGDESKDSLPAAVAQLAHPFRRERLS
jgi:uncharacterized phiE125 gp8 family phage protein